MVSRRLSERLPGCEGRFPFEGRRPPSMKGGICCDLLHRAAGVVDPQGSFCVGGLVFYWVRSLTTPFPHPVLVCSKTLLVVFSLRENCIFKQSGLLRSGGSTALRLRQKWPGFLPVSTLHGHNLSLEVAGLTPDPQGSRKPPLARGLLLHACPSAWRHPAPPRCSSLLRLQGSQHSSSCSACSLLFIFVFP